MSTPFPHSRTFPVASIPLPDPNTSPPADNTIFKLAKRPPSGDLNTTGNQIFFEFLDASGDPVLGPKVDWQVWFRDDQSGVWTNAEAVTGSGAYEAWITNDIRNSDVFVVVSSIAAAGAATQVVVRMSEV